VWAELATRLEGRIVVLEPLRPEHTPGLWRAAQDERVWRWMLTNSGASEQAFQDWIDTAHENAAAGREAPFAAVDAASGTPLGSTRYMSLRPEHRGIEIGHTWLASAAWGTGANAEAKLLLLEHAFERLGCMRVEFKTDAKNERSRRALAALPAQFEGVFRKHMLVGNDGTRLRDSAWYAIVDDDWPAVKANLEARLRR
jgi:RimJ/RimL family protein N-acetyltransferase